MGQVMGKERGLLPDLAASTQALKGQEGTYTDRKEAEENWSS